MKIMLQFIIVISLITIFSIDLLSDESTNTGYALIGIGVSQQKHNENNFNILNISLGAERRIKGFNPYGVVDIRIGITQILTGADLKIGTTYYFSDNAILGVRPYILLGGDGLFTNVAGGGGVATQINISESFGIVGEYGYRGTLKIWDIKSSQWYMSGSFAKVGISISGK